MQPMNELTLTDAHLTAYLLARGHQICRVGGPAGRREFTFADVPADDITTFYGGDDRVSARALLDALRNVKGLLQQPFAETAR
jgi:hypothetical protein